MPGSSRHHNHHHHGIPRIGNASSSSSLGYHHNHQAPPPPQQPQTPLSSLLELSSQVVALNYPFQLIEDRYKNIIPEPVQKSIIYHSFPKNESDVLVYASGDFNPDRYVVQEIVQIGFHVSGVVYEYPTSGHGNGGNSGSSGGTSSRRRTSRSSSRSALEDDENNSNDNGGHHGSSTTTTTALTFSSSSSSSASAYRVSATFDRGKITTTTCNCEGSGGGGSGGVSSSALIFWCDHVVALSIHRIRNNVQGKDFSLRIPISETLLQLNRSQLQKLVQYLISDHTDVLPTTQKIADEMLFMKTDDDKINRIHGAPDLTAGPSVDSTSSWALNETQIQAQVRSYVATALSNSGNSASNGNSSSTSAASTSAAAVAGAVASIAQAVSVQQNSGSSGAGGSGSSSGGEKNVIQVLIDKTYKMIAKRDTNAERILQIITNELVRYATKSHSRQQPTASSSSSSSSTVAMASSPVWDQVTRLWNVIVLKRPLSESEQARFQATLSVLANSEILPEFEEIEDEEEEEEMTEVKEAVDVPEDEDDEDSSDSPPSPAAGPSSTAPPKRQKLSPRTRHSIFWGPLRLLKGKTPRHDSQVLTLHSRVCHGEQDAQNTALALRIAASLRSAPPQGGGGGASITMENAHLLYDVLRRSSPKDAYQVALIALSTPTLLKHNAYVHEKHLKLTEKLIAKVMSLPPSTTSNSSLLTRYAERLAQKNTTTSTAATTFSQSPSSPHHHFPLIGFASYIFNALSGSELAYRVALKHLHIPSDTFVQAHLEAQQIALATSLFTNAKHEVAKLDEISSTLFKSIKSNTLLFRLAQEVFKHASNDNIIAVSFNIALHVVKATKYMVHRRRWEMVRYLVNLGVEIGVSKLFYLVHNWGEYFSPVEAVGTVASNILAWVGGGGGVTGSQGNVPGGGGAAAGVVGIQQQQGAGAAAAAGVGPVGGGGGTSGKHSAGLIMATVDKRILEDLANAARNLALACARNDPHNCSLNALTLCETDSQAFETSYQIVLESACKELLTPQQIFTIARYMEHRGYTNRAYRLAVTALQHVHIGYNQDANSMIGDVHWTVQLSHQLSSPLGTTASSSSTSSSSSSAQPPSSTSSSSSEMPSGKSHHCCGIRVQQGARGPPPPPPPAHHHSSQQHSQQQHHHHHHHHHSHLPPLLSPPTSELENLIPLLIRNIKCATVLAEILRRSITILSSYENAFQKNSSSSGQELGGTTVTHHHHHHHHHGSSSSSKTSSSSSGAGTSTSTSSTTSSSTSSSCPTKTSRSVYEKLSLLIEGVIDSFVTTTHSRLVHISPRHYSDFIDFLVKARENFLLAPNGHMRFSHLVDSMKIQYKGKKKLLFLLTERFG